jgi:hypothetical protein
MEILDQLLDLALMVAGVIGMGAVALVVIGSIIVAFYD